MAFRLPLPMSGGGCRSSSSSVSSLRMPGSSSAGPNSAPPALMSPLVSGVSCTGSVDLGLVVCSLSMVVIAEEARACGGD